MLIRLFMAAIIAVIGYIAIRKMDKMIENEEKNAMREGYEL